MDETSNTELSFELENIKTAFIDPLVKEQLSNAPPSPLKSKEQQAKELQDLYLSNFKQAMEIIQIAGKEILADPKFGITSPKHLNRLMNRYMIQFKRVEASIQSENIEKLPKKILNLQETLKISDKSMEAIYASTLEFYQAQNFEKACRYCLFAINLNPQYLSFWTMLAICEEHQKHWNEACLAYTVAATLEPTNLEMHIGVIRTQLQAGNSSEAEAYAKQVCHLLEEAKEKELVLSLKSLVQTFNIQI